MFTLAQIRQFQRQDPGARVLGRHAEAELAQFQEGFAWWHDLRAKLLAAEACFNGSIWLVEVARYVLVDKDYSRSSVIAKTLACLQEIMYRVLRDNNTFELGDSVFAAYLDRTLPALVPLISEKFDQMMEVEVLANK
jgi:hypothetical protein